MSRPARKLGTRTDYATPVRITKSGSRVPAPRRHGARGQAGPPTCVAHAPKGPHRPDARGPLVDRAPIRARGAPAWGRPVSHRLTAGDRPTAIGRRLTPRPA